VTNVMSDTTGPDARRLEFDQAASSGESDFTDEELTALALAADPEQPLDADAIALDLYPQQTFNLLPMWYMPPAMARGSRGWRTPVVLAIVAAFLVVDVFGLCITFGQLVAA
jgi:hypothetical protein